MIKYTRFENQSLLDEATIEAQRVLSQKYGIDVVNSEEIRIITAVMLAALAKEQGTKVEASHYRNTALDTLNITFVKHDETGTPHTFLPLATVDYDEQYSPYNTAEETDIIMERARLLGEDEDADKTATEIYEEVVGAPSTYIASGSLISGEDYTYQQEYQRDDFFIANRRLKDVILKAINETDIDVEEAIAEQDGPGNTNARNAVNSLYRDDDGDISFKTFVYLMFIFEMDMDMILKY